MTSETHRKNWKTIAAGKRPFAALAAVAVVIGGGWAALSAAQSPKTKPAERWYTPAQVQSGAHIFAAHCAVCHGKAGVGAADWRQRGADGAFPPPPLNGTAHTWHHPLAVLRQTIRRGGAPLGGVMPAFGDSLNAEEQDAVIAYIQSLWRDEIYAVWAEKVERIGEP